MVANNDRQKLLETALKLLNNQVDRRQLADKLGETAQPQAAKQLAGLLLSISAV